MCQSFSERLIGCRNKVGFTQTELAERVRVSLRTIQNWEQGNSKPPGGEKLRKLSAELGAPLSYLLDGLGPSSTETSLRETGSTAIGTQCHKHLQDFLNTCEDDPLRLGWTLIELRERFPLDRWENPPNSEIEAMARRILAMGVQMAESDDQERQPKPKAVSPSDTES